MWSSKERDLKITTPKRLVLSTQFIQYNSTARGYEALQKLCISKVSQLYVILLIPK